MNVDKSAALNDLNAAMSEDSSDQQTPPDQSQSSTPPATDFYELPWENGKPLKIPMNYEFPIKDGEQVSKVPFNTLLNRYRLTGVLEKKVKELQEKYAPYEQEVGDLNEWKTKTEKYRVLQDWSENNPEEFDRIYALFEQAKAGVAGQSTIPPQLADSITKLNQKIEMLEGELGGYRSEKQKVQDQKDVEFIQGQITSFEKDYPYFPLTEKTVDGVPRRDAIIHFGLQNGYPDFVSAAMALYGKDLIDAAQENAKKALSESIKTDNKNGVINRTRIPNGQGNGNSDVPPKPTGDRKVDALADFNALLAARRDAS